MARTKNNISAHRYRKPPGRHVQSTNLPSASDCHTILLKASRGHLCRQLQGLSGLVCPYLSGSSLRIQPNIVTRFRNFFSPAILQYAYFSSSPKGILGQFSIKKAIIVIAPAWRRQKITFPHVAIRNHLGAMVKAPICQARPSVTPFYSKQAGVTYAGSYRACPVWYAHTCLKVACVSNQYRHKVSKLFFHLQYCNMRIFQPFLVFPINTKSFQTKPKRPAWRCRQAGRLGLR